MLNVLPFKFYSLKDLGLSDEGLEEDGKTYAENAYKKAKFFTDKAGMIVLAEDSGLVVDALEGELGVKTRRWGAGEKASDKEWIDYFLERMSGVENRKAKFLSSLCLLDESRDLKEIFDGETNGLITRKLMAPILEGLPLSSCFIPEGFDLVYASLSDEERYSVSHRALAVSKLRAFLENY